MDVYYLHIFSPVSVQITMLLQGNINRACKHFGSKFVIFIYGHHIISDVSNREVKCGKNITGK